VTTTPRRRRQKRGLLVSLQNCGKEELYRTSSSLLPTDAKNKEKCGRKPAEEEQTSVAELFLLPKKKNKSRRRRRRRKRSSADL
jgi:hypothetical protein